MVSVILAFLLLYSVPIETSSLVNNPQPVFNFTMTSPNTNPQRNAWAALMAEELPKAGIGLKHLSVAWDVLGPRTYAHARDGTCSHYKFDSTLMGPGTECVGRIPTYEDGGYDIFYVGLSGSIYYNPTKAYSNEEYSPKTWNFASIDNDDLTKAIIAYRTEFDPVKRLPLAKAVQAIMYGEQHYINMLNTGGVWAFNNGLLFDGVAASQDNFVLLSTKNLAAQSALWSHPTQTRLVYGHPYRISQFHPFTITDYISKIYTLFVYSYLYEYDVTGVGDYEYMPSLAASMPVWSENNTKATITLNASATFSDGSPVLPSDVANSFHMHMSPDWSVGYYSITTYLDSYDSVAVDGLDVAGGKVTIKLNAPLFSAIGDVFQVTIHKRSSLGTPSATVSYGGVPALGPLGELDANGNPWDWNRDVTKYIGSGPYMWDTIDKVGYNIKLVKNANWWGGAVGFDEIQFNFYAWKSAALAALEAGDIDILDSQFKPMSIELDPIAGTNYYVFPDFGTQMLVFNMDHPVFGTGIDTPLGKADPTKAEDAARYIRQAFSHLVPRDYIVEEIVNNVGTAGTTLWPELAHGYDTSLQPFPYSVAKAQELVEMAGYELHPKTVASTSSTESTTETTQTTKTATSTTSKSSASLNTIDPLPFSWWGLYFGLSVMVALHIFSRKLRK
ncbi:MAG: ABC transporter substrate-binding protein [Candidatus Kariarchaeaceae archaeon]